MRGSDSVHAREHLFNLVREHLFATCVHRGHFAPHDVNEAVLVNETQVAGAQPRAPQRCRVEFLVIPVPVGDGWAGADEFTNSVRTDVSLARAGRQNARS